MEDNNLNNNNNGNNNRNGNTGKGNSDSKVFLRILIISLGLTFLFNLLMTSMALRTQSEINYSEFLNWVEEDKVEKVEFRSDRLVVYPYYDKLDDKYKTVPNDMFYVGNVSYDELVNNLQRL